MDGRLTRAAAWQLTSTLSEELREIEETLRRRHPYVAGAEFTPKRNNRTQGYVEGASFTRLKELNCTSRDHIAWILTTYYGWTPTQTTATGKPIVDEVILTEIGSEDFYDVCEMFDGNENAWDDLSNGTNAWLKLVTNEGRIHHHCSVATNTHRCAHRNPKPSTSAKMTKDLENFLYQVQVSLWSALILVGLSFACYLTILRDSTADDMPTSSSMETSIKLMLTK